MQVTRGSFILWLLVAPALLYGGATYGSEIGEILNYRAYSDNLSSAGQPTEAQLQALPGAGYRRVVYLAFSDHHRALAHEDVIVEQLGMEFVHVPVVWAAPTLADFRAFAAALNSEPQARTLVHCELNFRASSFTFLYRVLHQQVPIDEALEDLQAVWIPTETWQAFIFDTLEAYGVSPDCDACMW